MYALNSRIMDLCVYTAHYAVFGGQVDTIYTPISLLMVGLSPAPVTKTER